MYMEEAIVKEVASKNSILKNLTIPQILSLLPKVRLKVLKTKKLLYGPGDIDSNIYFLANGILKAYYNEGDKQVVTIFFDSGSFLSNSPTFFNEGMAWVNIEAVTKSTLYYFSRDTYFKYLQESNYMLNAVLEVYQAIILRHHLKLRTIMNLNAIERYQLFSLENEKILPFLPLKDIASYLNVTPETLSRVRKNN